MDEKADSDKETFVKLIRYSTPITIGILLYVGIAILDGELIFMIPITVMVLVEVLIGLKAEKLYGMLQNDEEEES